MAKGLTWEIILKDSVSLPAKKAGASLDKVSGSVSRTTRATEALATSQTKLEKIQASAAKADKSRAEAAAAVAKELDKVVQATRRAMQAQKRANSATKSSGDFRAILGQGLSGVSAGRGGVGGVLSLVAGGGGAAALAFAGVAAAVAGVAAAAYAAAKAFSTMGSAAMAASKWAVEGLSFKESSLASLKTMTGSTETARGLFGQALGLAGKTPFGGADIVNVYKRLLGAGFDKGELSSVFQGIGDISALNGFDKNIFSQLSLVFGQIKGMGKLTTQDMKQMLGATGGIVGEGRYKSELAKILGIHSDNVGEAISGGKVTSNMAINAFLKSVMSATGGPLGQAMLDQSKTLAGQLSTLRDAPMQMLMSMDTEKGGFAKLKAVVGNLNSIFDTTSESGERFANRLAGFFDRLWTTVFGDLTGEEGLKALETGIEKVFKTAEVGVNAFMAGVEGLKGMAAGFFDALGFGGEMSPQKWEEIGRKMADAGRMIGSVLAKVVNGLVWAAEKVAAHPTLAKFLLGGGFLTPAGPAALMQGAKEEASDAWNWLTSRKQGEYADGPDVGWADGGIVNRPTRALVGEAGPEAIIPLKRSHGEGLSSLRGMGGGSVVVNVSLSVDARGNSSGQDIASAIAGALPSAIADALEGLALEVGGAW